jgi:hypothetical protein
LRQLLGCCVVGLQQLALQARIGEPSRWLCSLFDCEPRDLLSATDWARIWYGRHCLGIQQSQRVRALCSYRASMEQGDADDDLHSRPAWIASARHGRFASRTADAAANLLNRIGGKP